VELFTKNAKSRSPIESGAALPAPGQTLMLKYFEQVFGMIMWALIVIAAGIYAMNDWLAEWLHTPPTPRVKTALFVATVFLAIWRVRKIKKESDQVLLGFRGERAVGQHLDKLRAKGYHIFHDVPSGDNANIDHVIIGPTGVYAVETKTHSKPIKGKCEVTYDGTQVLINGFAPDRNPIVQALAEARSLRKLLAELTAIEVDVQPVVIYLGWYVISLKSRSEVSVTNEKYFLKSIDGSSRKQTLDDSKIELLAASLERSLRQRSLE
jgi:hypothetical protein